MKKTITANIAGKLFILNDDAFEMLERYLKNKGFEHKSASANTEFENRVCELLEQRSNNRIVETADIYYIISVLGPAQNQNTFDESGNETIPYKRRQQRKLYRDTSNRVIGGVCSGLGAYFDVDTVLIRILFLILFFTGFGFLAYLILWIVTPKARTPEQKAELYGYEQNKF